MVHHPSSHQLTITWNVTALTIDGDGLETPRCRDCETALNIHQPDEDRPEHLLGTCALCGNWYLIELGKGRSEAFMYDLPNVTLIHAAIGSARAKTGPKRPHRRAGDASECYENGGQVA